MNKYHKVGELWKHYAKWKKSGTTDHILYDLICMKFVLNR